MNYAVDVHGTLDRDPDIIKNWMEICAKYSKVYVISGPPSNQIKKELDNLGCIHQKHYHGILSVVDYNKQIGTPMEQDKNGNWWFDDSLWWKTKGLLCGLFNINIIIDNDIRYKEWMPDFTEFIHWKKKGD